MERKRGRRKRRGVKGEKKCVSGKWKEGGG